MAIRRRLERVGRLRALLRLGKRADARSPRHRFLAPHGDAGQRRRTGARLRHRTRDHSGRACRRSRGRRRSIGGHAHACAPALEARASGHAGLMDSQRHPSAAVPIVGALQSRHGAVRDSPVPRSRIRSEGDAGLGCAGVAEGRHLRHRPRPGSAGLEGVPEQGAIPGIAAGWPVTHHARGIGSPGPEKEAHDLRPDIRRVARPARGARTGFRSCFVPSPCRK